MTETSEEARLLAERRARRVLGGVSLMLGVAVVGAASVVLQVTAGERPARSNPQHLARQPADNVAPAVPPMPSKYVTYELSGDSGARNITYVGNELTVAQETSAELPWSRTLEQLTPSSGYFSISAQNPAAGSLTCRIVVDGQVVSQKSTTVAKNVVTCSHSR
ncbi:MmpS family protein [Saccharothrix sp. AJ9571]|nr:MmpS family protein [Saccharothrix sp. AJ9571]